MRAAATSFITLKSRPPSPRRTVGFLKFERKKEGINKDGGEWRGGGGVMGGGDLGGEGRLGGGGL